MTEWATIKVPEDDRDRARGYLDDANERRPDGSEKLTYGDALVAGSERLNDYLDSDTSSFYAEATIKPTLDDEALEDIHAELEAVASEALAADFPTSDVKEAVREVIREEFPEGALR